MRPQALVFDWDGTLWDSWALHLGGLEAVARSLGRPVPSPRRVASLMTGDLGEHLSRLFGEPAEALLGPYMEFYRAQWRDLGHPFPGVREVLRALKEKGLRLGLLSNKERGPGAQEMAFAGLDGLLDVVLWGEDQGARKPEPEGLRRVVEALGVSPQEVLYVGDTPVDVLCARRAGTGAVGALWGCQDPHALHSARPDLLWERPQDALTLP